jgi:prepilin-type processing-associated H-X9-DG protein
LLLCPSDGQAGSTRVNIFGTYCLSNYVAFLGDRPYLSALPPTHPYFQAPAATKAAFGIGVYRRFAEFHDGMSNSLMLGEYLTGLAKEPYDQRGLFWGDEAGCSHIMTYDTPNAPVDDWLDWCPPSTDQPSMNLPCHPSDNEVAAARSRHPGGVHVAMADGAVQWVSDNIALSVWRALGSIDGFNEAKTPAERKAETNPSPF